MPNRCNFAELYSSCSTEQLELKPLGVKQCDHPGYTYTACGICPDKTLAEDATQFCKTIRNKNSQ